MIGPNVDGKSAVATLDGRRRKKRIQLLSFNNFSKMRSALHTNGILAIMEMTTYKTGHDVWSRMLGS